MNIHFETNPELTGDQWKTIVELFDKVGWEKRTVESIQSATKTGSAYCVAFHGDIPVGFGRTIDDGQYYGMIVDVMIDPIYQGQGIGRQIVDLLKEQLDSYLFVTLSAAPGKHEFYEKIGWSKQTSAFIYPRNEKQFHDHCT